MFVFKFYKKYISPMLGERCRFYPTCSEYSQISFMFQNPLLAIINTIARLIRCNQLFKGGIDYPTTNIRPIVSMLSTQNKIDICFWIIPKDEKYFYVIKKI